MEKRWLKKKYSATELSKLINNHGFSRPIALALAARGIASKNVETFFKASLGDLSSPYRIPGIENAAKRLWDALKKDEHILIHGDFDVDGVTASALLVKVLTDNGAKVGVFIPQRFDTGYGFSPESLDRALEKEKYQLLAAFARGKTILNNVSHARFKETDRITAMANELTKMGAKVKELEGGLIINSSSLKSVKTLDGYNDHRIIMSLAIAGMGLEGETIVNNSRAVSVTYPSFVKDFQNLGADIEIIK